MKHISRNKKKGEVQFWMVMLILGLILFVVVVIIQTGAFKKFLNPVDTKKNDTVSRLSCLVATGSEKDQNNDGIDDKEECKKFAENYEEKQK